VGNFGLDRLDGKINSVSYMDYIYSFFIFFIGLVFGSFLGVVLFRLNRKSGIFAGRSECPLCQHRLSWLDLVPIISFSYLKGKCRYCHKKIPNIYPIAEVTTGLIFVSYCQLNYFCLDYNKLFGLILVFLFLIVLFFDYKYYIVPDKILVLIFIVAFVRTALLYPNGLLGLLITGFAVALFFAIIYLVSQGRWIGLGDVKLAFVIGFVLGYPQALIVILGSIWVGALWGIGLILLKKATLKTALPFGSFLSAATVLFVIFKDVIEEQINNFQYFL